MAWALLSSGSRNLYWKFGVFLENSFNKSSACCLTELSVSADTKNAFAITSLSNSSNTWIVCCDKENTLVAVTSILVGFVYIIKLTTKTITKKAIVSAAALTPYLPLRPTTKIAIALGDIKIAKNISADPTKITHKDKLDKPSKAKYIDPPSTTEAIPAVADMILQKFVDKIRDRIISL